MKSLYFVLLIPALAACNLTSSAEPTRVFSPTPENTNVVEIEPCPVASAEPALAQPDDLSGYGSAIQVYLSAGGDPQALRTELDERSLLPLTEEPEDGVDLPKGQGVYEADITGNGYVDVVVNARTTFDPEGSQPPASGMWVYACDDEADTYTLVEERVGAGSPMPGDGHMVSFVHDITNDGNPDVVTHLTSCGAHTCFSTLDVLSWNGGALRSVLAEQVEWPYGTYTVGEDGLIDITTGTVAAVGAGVQRQRKIQLRWDGQQISEISNEALGPAEYDFQAVYDGLDALGDGNYDAALAAFDTATTLPTFGDFLESDPRGEVVVDAVATYGTLVATAARDGFDAGSTQVAYAEVTALPEALPPFGDIPQELNMWRRYGELFYTAGDLSAGCIAVREDITTQDAALVEQGVSSGLYNELRYWPYFGYANAAPTAQKACPL